MTIQTSKILFILEQIFLPPFTCDNEHIYL